MKSRTSDGKYSESFKIHVVAEVESGRLNKSEAKRKFGVAGSTTILKWCRKYGVLKTSKNPQKAKYIKMTSEPHEIIKLNNEIKALKEELDNARMKNVVLETLVDIAEKELEIPIRKNFGAKQSGK
jgi:transposase-like protein